MSRTSRIAAKQLEKIEKILLEKMFVKFIFDVKVLNYLQFSLKTSKINRKIFTKKIGC